MKNLLDPGFPNPIGELVTRNAPPIMLKPKKYQKLIYIVTGRVIRKRKFILVT